MLFDANAYSGVWPFGLRCEQTVANYAAAARQAGISGAAISPLGAFLETDPMRANRELFQTVRIRPLFRPVPIVNPVLASWRDQLAECGAQKGVRAVRIAPTYHNYTLRSGRLPRFMRELDRLGLKLVVTVRLEDERHRYFALKVTAVPFADLIGFFARFSDTTPLCTGLAMSEVERLAARAGNFFADVSYTECLRFAATLKKAIPLERAMFGSLSPLVSLPAQAAKMADFEFTPDERRAVGSGNAKGFFAP